jgi:hypothetical protein
MFGPATERRPWKSLTSLSATLQDFAALVLSAVHGFLGDKDAGLTILERLFEERLGALVGLNGRMYDPLRGSPRFQDLMRRIGLPQVPRQA